MTSSQGAPTTVASLRARLPEMLAALERLVNAESPSADVEAAERCARVIDALCHTLLGVELELIECGGRPHLRRAWGEPRVLLLGHFDTVWPVGTVRTRPFRVEDGSAVGPGVFDMKAGIVQGLFALAALPELAGVELLLTSDEEVGSPTSRTLVEEAARHVSAVLVLEPSAAGALKVARKGSSSYSLSVRGRAAHAGLEPELGTNALVEMAAQVLAVGALADEAHGTSVTPAVAAAGTTANSVPDQARFTIDVRAWTTAELERVDRGVRALVPVVRGAALAVEGGIDRPPLEPEASRDLYACASACARALGLPRLEAAAVGGGSDGSLTAALGVPTLDGLGAVGAGAHAPDERVEVHTMPERAALVASLVGTLSGVGLRDTPLNGDGTGSFK
jgi:glutamate carboxypeptidase